MKGIKNENDGKKSLHGIRRIGKTPLAPFSVAVRLSSNGVGRINEVTLRRTG